MKPTIYKFQISPSKNLIRMPADAKILSIQLQNGLPFVWVLFNPDSEFVERVFEIYETGQKIPNAEKTAYIGTFRMQKGNYVFHVFERKS